MSDHSMAVRSDARAAGMVTAHTTRVSAPWSTMRTNCRGYADTDAGRELASQGIASVRVIHADGTEVTRSVHSFRKGSDGSRVARAKAVAATQNDCQRFADTIGYVGDL